MTIRIDAYVLLKKSWTPDFTAVAAELEWRYPQIGKVRKRRGSGDEEKSATIMVEGAPVEVNMITAPYPPEHLLPPMKMIGFDLQKTAELTQGQSSYLLISVTSPSADLEWVRAHAALVTLVTVAVAAKAGASAVFWADSWSCMDSQVFEAQSADVLRGAPPVELWCSFAHANPSRVGGAGMNGIASLGLRAFGGRELELAPVADLPGAAVDDMRDRCRRLIAGEWVPEDQEKIRLDAFDDPLTVRLSDGFMRPGVPAVVLVAVNASVDAETMARKGSAVSPQGKGGLLGRIFKRG